MRNISPIFTKDGKKSESAKEVSRGSGRVNPSVRIKSIYLTVTVLLDHSPTNRGPEGSA
jgi:hypothetical protein